MDIAVIDGGFKGIEDNFILENIDIKEHRNFIHIEDNDYESDHGLRVLSCMATNMPHIFVGTAPEASYWLFQSENPASEYPVEEDYWVAAAEYADSLGIDIINTSLGYTTFNDTLLNHTYSEMNGRTVFISKGATMAASKGILVVSSAGNEGNSEWRHISAPGDPENVLTIGAIRSDSSIAAFSSRGPTADLRIKPDIVAIGSGTAAITWDGNVGYTSGTSYSSPIICGLAACLWQAFPYLTNLELMDIIRQSGDRSKNPDNDYGYGIPNMVKAMELAEKKTNIYSIPTKTTSHVSILSDSTGNITIVKNNDDSLLYNIQIMSFDGKILLNDNFTGKVINYRFDSAKKNLYIIRIETQLFIETRKIWF